MPWDGATIVIDVSVSFSMAFRTIGLTFATILVK
jgi:hypothetical protein